MENKDILNKILQELITSKELNKHLHSDIKETLKDFENDLSRLAEKQGFDKNEMIEMIRNFEKTIDQRINEVEKTTISKINEIEKKVIVVDSQSAENTKDHKTSRDILIRSAFLIFSAFVGLVIYIAKN